MPRRVAIAATMCSQKPLPTAGKSCRGAWMTGDLVLCPLCGHPLGDTTSRDHVFGDAFGGRFTVRTHPTCNSSIGGAAEGRLHSGDSFINFVASVQGLQAAEVPGTAQDGTRVSTDFAGRRTSLAKPEVSKTEDAKTVQLKAVGRAEHLKKVLADWRKAYGDQVPRWVDLTPEQRASAERGPEEIEMHLSLDLADAEAFAVKAALGAGVLAFGEDFAGSELAESLRRWAASPFDNPLVEGSTKPRRQLEMLDALDRLLTSYAAEMAKSGMEVDLPAIVPSPHSSTNQVTFVPLPKASGTALFLHLLGTPLPPYGLQLEGHLPRGELGIPTSPIVVREGDGELEIVRTTERLMEPVVKAARHVEEEGLAEDEEG